MVREIKTEKGDISMKVNKLLCFAISLTLLGGCGTDTTADKTDKKVESAETKKEVLTKDTYVPTITALTSDFTKELSELQIIALSDKSNKDKTKEANKKLDELQKMTDKFRNIEPPEEFKDTHEGIVKAMDYYSKGFKLQKEAINDNLNQDKVNQSFEQFKLGSEAWIEAASDISDMQTEQVNGLTNNLDGSASDTKSDSSDRPINISQDGKELVGKWGSYIGSDFYVGLEFNSDGTFAGYDDTGVYSHEDNYFNGKWSYDSNSKTITLNVANFVKDGEKQEFDHSKELEIYVKYFNAGAFEFTDSSSDEPITYEKQQ